MIQNVNIIIASLAMAFCWVNYVNWFFVGLRSYSCNTNLFKKKPFTCVKCMTGWFAVIIGVCFYGLVGLVFLPVGVFIGAIFSSIQMRWL